jgi:uncharacterized protein YyaL (SSP411 family)
VNRLSGQTSPYLRQHAGDPVDWYPWGDEALARAKELDRPLFISIGYSSCHWCHVMGHESFADPATAEVMNSHFVSVKVDREERPDLDAIYMEAVQAASGHGGWPMSVFATPEGRPFVAGTYFPNRARHGMPSFGQLLQAVIEAWGTRRHDVENQAHALANAVASRLGSPGPPPGAPAGKPQMSGQTEALSDQAVERLESIFDAVDGGFGSAPKFPQPLLLDLLLRDHLRTTALEPLEMVQSTLSAMASGGIYDHLGGGFARYSVDHRWAVPHFEKMLYDQALIARVYLHAWQLDGDERWLQVLDETLSYVLRDLRDPGGGLYSAEDADSEGEEGRFYLWTAEGLTSVLGSSLADEAASWYGVTPAGNFEGGTTVLHRALRGDLRRPPEIEDARARLLAARSGRVRPGLDDKVITEWNAMMCSTLAETAAATGRDDWAGAAEQIAKFLLEHLKREDGRVLRSWCRGRADLPGYAVDYAWLVDCLTRLGELSGDQSWTTQALVTARELLRLFADVAGWLYTTGSDQEPLVVRPRERHDGVTPAANSVAAVALARLGALAGDDVLTEAAERIVQAAMPELEAAPLAFGELLLAAGLLERGPVEIAVTGERPDLVRAVQRHFLPTTVLAWRSAPGRGAGAASATGEPEGFQSPLLAERDDGFAYVCLKGSCLAPVDNVEALLAAIGSALGLP